MWCNDFVIFISSLIRQQREVPSSSSTSISLTQVVKINRPSLKFVFVLKRLIYVEWVENQDERDIFTFEDTITAMMSQSQSRARRRKSSSNLRCEKAVTHDVSESLNEMWVECGEWERRRTENHKNLQSQEQSNSSSRVDDSSSVFCSFFALFVAHVRLTLVFSVHWMSKTRSRRILMKSEMKISSIRRQWKEKWQRWEKIMWRNESNNENSSNWKWIKENEREHTTAARILKNEMMLSCDKLLLNSFSLRMVVVACRQSEKRKEPNKAENWDGKLFFVLHSLLSCPY